MVADRPRVEEEALETYGMNLGIAFQLIDDVLDFSATSEEMGKPVGSDLLAGTLTLPTLLYLDRYPEDNPVQRAFAGVRRRSNLQRAITEIKESGLLEESLQTASKFVENAHQSLNELPHGEPRVTFECLLEYVLERRN